MKKYTEVKNKAPFDWNAALSKDCKDMKLVEASKMINKSQTWVTCACGNQCAIIPRDNEGEPLNKRLNSLGVDFHSEGVYEMYKNLADYTKTSGDAGKFYLKQANKYRKKAIRILKKIEIVSGKLVEEEIIKAKKLLTEFGYKIS